MESEWRLTGREGGHKSQAERMSQDLKDSSRRVKANDREVQGSEEMKVEDESHD